MDFQWHIDLGNVLTIISIVIGIVAGVLAIYARLDKLDSGVVSVNTRMDGVDDELKKQTDILVQLATQRERLNSLDARNNAMEKRIDELFTRLFNPKGV